MAMMGAFIGLSFTLSMILSPILSHRYGLSSLFYLSIAVTVVCIVLLYTAVGKEPKIAHSQAKTPALKLLANRNLLLMNVSNFMQKMLMSAAFIIIPIAVVRYFGGIKLGAGGLIRAYAHAAGLALDAAQKVRMTPLQTLCVVIDYDLLAAAERYVRDMTLLTGETSYAEAVTLTLLVPPDDIEMHRSALTDLTAGRAKYLLGSKDYTAVPLP